MTKRYNELVWMAEDDPARITIYERMAIVEYYILLDKKRNKGKEIQDSNKKPTKPVKS